MSAPVILTEQGPRERELETLEDGGHVLIVCSNCRARLVDVWVLRPHEPEKWWAEANCPFCGDKSYPKEWVGGFYPGGIERETDDPEAGLPSTAIADVVQEGNHIKFLVEKRGNAVFERNP